MVRSLVPSSNNRRKSQRLQQTGAATDNADIPGVAARRRTSKDSSSTSDLSCSQDPPPRDLIKRGTHPAWETEPEDEMKSSGADRRPSAAVLQNSTNSRGRKRSDSISETTLTSSQEAPHLTSKRRKTETVSAEARIGVIVNPTTDDTMGPPLTRSQKHKLLVNQVTQVTPSPAHNSASPAFSFNSPAPKKKPRDFELESTLPDGVMDLYPKGDALSRCHTNSVGCFCNQDHCSSTQLNASFLRAYGKEYFQHMKDNEEPAVLPPSPTSSRSSNRSSRTSRGSNSRRSGEDLLMSPNPSSENSAAGSSAVSYQTPALRRDWVFIDTSSLTVMKPTESTKFLNYQPELTPKMRAILMDWIIELSDHFSFSQNTLHLAITLIDKVLACGPSTFEEFDDEDFHWDDDGSESQTTCLLISRDRFQLLGATCTWLACKMEELNAPQIAQIAYVSDNIYTVDQIKRMERRVCKALDFSLIHQTPFPYIFEFMRASSECPNPGCQPTPVFHHMVMYLLELGRLPYAPVTENPSLLAAAAVYLARVTLDISGGAWTKTLEYYTGYTKEDLKETVLAVHSYHMASEDSSLKSVFAKYKCKKYHRVALKTVLPQVAIGL